MCRLAQLLVNWCFKDNILLIVIISSLNNITIRLILNYKATFWIGCIRTGLM